MDSDKFRNTRQTKRRTGVREKYHKQVVQLRSKEILPTPT